MPHQDPHHAHEPNHDPEPSPLVVVVCGSHLMAEQYDRAVAYRVREAIASAIARAGLENPHLRVIVCSDIWYLNQEELRALPTVSIGAPTVSALAAYFADRLPSVMAVDGVMIVQMDDVEGVPVASCWGVSAGATAAAAEQFITKHLDTFLEGVRC